VEDCARTHVYNALLPERGADGSELAGEAL
jgi:hypothetical protein